MTDDTTPRTENPLQGYGEFFATQLDLAEEFTADPKHLVLYSRAKNLWYAWSGKHWEPDAEDAAWNLVAAFMRGLRDDAVVIGAKRVEKLNTMLSNGSLNGILSIVEHLKTVNPLELDTDPWLLNAANGTVDLRTGTIREHQHQDLITRLLPVAYDPEATCPTWEKFLDRIFAGDTEMIGFIQRAVGYSITGLTREQVVFYCYGTGANGKSVLMTTIQHALGEYRTQHGYAMEAARGLISVRSESGPTGDVADLDGARFVALNENAKGQSIDEAQLKRITGGDLITARQPHGRNFTFEPGFTLWIRANYKYEITGTDEGIWRRIRLVPFEVQIPEDERDPDLQVKLDAELPGVLAWMVQGAVAYHQNGLMEPDKVLEATSSYREDSDEFTRFLSECCITDPNKQVSASDLLKVYNAWSGDRKSATWLGRELRERGYEHRRTSMQRGWIGLSIKTDWLHVTEFE